MSERAESFSEALPQEMARVRDVVMPIYAAIGVAGRVALAFMRGDLDRAAKAMAEGDVVAMMHAYSRLKDYQE